MKLDEERERGKVVVLGPELWNLKMVLPDSSWASFEVCEAVLIGLVNERPKEGDIGKPASTGCKGDMRQQQREHRGHDTRADQCSPWVAT